jgi:hypothetical protein
MVKNARVAGALYLLLVVIAPFSIMYIPGKLIVSGDATATAGNIVAHEMLFRLGIVGGLISIVIFIFLVMALHRLLGGVNENQARLMVGLVLVTVAISFMNTLNNIAALILARGADYLSVFDKRQLDALAYLFLQLHGQGQFVNEILWGLWLFPFGLLVFKSGFLPRILGVLLIVNGVAYVVLSLAWMLVPAYGNVLFKAFMPALLGEIWIMLWLLIRGAKVQPSAASTS